MAARALLPCAFVLGVQGPLGVEAGWHVVSGGCQESESSKDCIVSPGYDKDAAVKMYTDEPCTIHVEDDEEFKGVDVTAFDTELNFDKLVVGPKEYSGNFRPSLPDTAGKMVWSSDSGAVGAGWKICANDLQAPMFQVVGGPCALDTGTGCISSPNYPLEYGTDERCDIEVPLGFKGMTVSAFDVDSTDFLLDQYNKPHYGGIPNTFFPEKGSTIQWLPDKSDDPTKKVGFVMCVTEKNFQGGGGLESMPASVAAANAAASTGAAAQDAVSRVGLPTDEVGDDGEMMGAMEAATAVPALAHLLLGGGGLALMLVGIVALRKGPAPLTSNRNLHIGINTQS